MKRICLIMAALLVGLSSMSAKKTKETKSDLVGIWQQVRNIEHGDGKVNIVFNPVLKIIEKDGTFSTMFVNSPQSAGTITQRGTFTVKNDSLYSETVKAHFMPEKIGITLPIKYHFTDKEKDVLILEFENNGANVVMREMWIRISDKHIRK